MEDEELKAMLNADADKYYAEKMAQMEDCGQYVLTDDQCDLLVADVLDKLAKKASKKYSPMHACDLNPNITEHHALRRDLVREAYMLGALATQPRPLDVK